MAVQTSVAQTPAIGVEGMLADNGLHDVLSGVAAGRKLLSVAIGASNSQVYSITLNGVAYTYTADGSATTAEIAAGLVAAINAGQTAVHASGSDTPILLESTVDGPDGDFTYADSAGTGTLVETTLVAQSAALSVGKYVCLDERRTLGGAEDYAIRAPRQATDITGGRGLGIVIEEFDLEQLPVTASTYSTSLTLPANQVLNVLHKGRCLVKVEAAVSKGGYAFARFASGAGGSVLGAIRGDADSASAAQIPNGARFLTSADANGLAVVEVNG